LNVKADESLGLKQLKFSSGTRKRIKSIYLPQIWLVITRGLVWGCSSKIFHFLVKLADLNPKIELRLILRDEESRVDG